MATAEAKEIMQQISNASFIERWDEVPLAEAYVVTHDTFMSGCCEGAKNILVLVCEDQAQAAVVADNCKGRCDQADICIYSRAGLEGAQGWLFAADHVVQIKTAESMPHWYKPGSW